MKKLIGVIFVIQLLLIAGWGVYQARAMGDVSFVDEKTGIMVKQDTPESALISYYELTASDAYESAYRLLSKESQEAITVDVMKNLVERTRMEDARLAKVFPGKVKGDVGLVAYVRTAAFGDRESAILGMAVLELEDGRWVVLKTMDHYSNDQVKEVIRMALDLEDEMAADPLSEFDEYQKGQIGRQVRAMKQTHQQALVALNNSLNGQKAGEKTGQPGGNKSEEMPGDSVRGQAGEGSKASQ